MQNSKKNKLVLSVASVALAASLLIGGGTLAYLRAESTPVVNEFKANKVEVELTETGDGQYNIIPGTSEEKDPTVTVDNSVDAYVYVEVTDTTDGLVGYTIAEGWALLDGYDNVYYREVSADAAEKTFPVLEGKGVLVSAAKNAVVNVKSGTFIVKEAYSNGEYYTLNAEDDQNGVFCVTGGTFKNFDPSNSKAENPAANWVSEGFAVQSSADGADTWYTVVPATA